MASPGVTDELFVYLATDDDGYTNVLMAETAALAKVPLVAETRKKAQAMRPIAKRLAELTGRPVTLACFSTRSDVEVLGVES